MLAINLDALCNLTKPAKRNNLKVLNSGQWRNHSTKRDFRGEGKELTWSALFLRADLLRPPACRVAAMKELYSVHNGMSRRVFEKFRMAISTGN